MSMSIKYNNVKIIGLSTDDSIKVLANSDLVNKLISFRKTITKYVNVRDGYSSNLIIVTDSEKCSERLNRLILDNWFVKSIEKEYRVKIESFRNGKEVQIEFNPISCIFECKATKLTLNEFLYVTKDINTLEKYLAENNIDENSNIKLGSKSVQALVRFCMVLSKYKDKFYIEMTKPN